MHVLSKALATRNIDLGAFDGLPFSFAVVPQAPHWSSILTRRAVLRQEGRVEEVCPVNNRLS